MNIVQETLEQCSLKLQKLSGDIDRIRSLSNTTSSADLLAPPPTPASPTTMTGKRAAARCHECHGPIAGYHQGYPHGLGICQLEHYDMCPGGILEKDRGGHSWTACPPEYEPPGEKELATNMEDQFSPTDPGHSSPEGSKGDKDDFESVEEVFDGMDNQRSVWTDPAIKINLLKSPLPKEDVLTKNIDEKSEADLLIEAELAELKIAEEEEKKLLEVANIRKRKEQSLQNIARLARQAQGEGARTRTSLHANIDMIRTSNRQQDLSRREASGYQGPTMPDIRKDTRTGEDVDVLMDTVYHIPAFSNARHGQPRLKQHKSQVSPAITQNRQDSFTRVNREPPAHRPVREETLFKWVYRRDQYGRDYKELVEASPERHPPVPKEVVEADPGWYYDEQSGRMYMGQPPAPTNGHASSAMMGGNPHIYSDSRIEGQTPARQQHRAEVSHTPAAVRSDVIRSERFPGIVPLVTNSTEEKEGKIPLSIASHARNLPMEYARSATSKNMNFAVFMYGAIHELHSSRIGITPAMQRGVLEAKLQHLLNVIHVTCLNSSAADFKPVAWSVGRTYHNLIQAKVDSGREGWTDFDVLHRGSPHAAEMIAAEREHRAALTAKPEKVVKKTDRKDDRKDEKPTCTTWNEYEEEGKCKYEAEHPGEKCNRSHHCSYCKKKYPANHTLHQARFCKRKLEDEK